IGLPGGGFVATGIHLNCAAFGSLSVVTNDLRNDSFSIADSCRYCKPARCSSVGIVASNFAAAQLDSASKPSVKSFCGFIARPNFRSCPAHMQHGHVIKSCDFGTKVCIDVPVSCETSTRTRLQPRPIHPMVAALSRVRLQGKPPPIEAKEAANIQT